MFIVTSEPFVLSFHEVVNLALFPQNIRTETIQMGDFFGEWGAKRKNPDVFCISIGVDAI
jgi:hypothetical protein